MSKKKFKSFEELPLVLSVEDVANVMGICIAYAYELTHRRDFPSFTVGTRILVPKEKFIAWLDEQTKEKTEML